jgi:Skp family chaperone for outer membrane proteins
MWQAAIGALVGYLFALWWVRRDARKEIEAVRGMFAGRLDAREAEIAELRESFDKSQRAVAAYERRSRYLEAAVASNFGRISKGEDAPVGPAQRPG